MDSPPLLSILIPTKDRFDTLIPVVFEILARIDDPRLEIVIADNSERRDERIDALLASDTRILYRHTPVPVSIVDNTQFGIALCRGDYLCFIGDDDLVSPHIMPIVEWMAARGEDCLIYPPAMYWWCSVQFAKPDRFRYPGAFWVPKAHDGTLTQLDGATELAKVLARGGVSYMNLPRFYHGIVSRRAIDAIRKRFGCFVPGASPDMALCTALALTNTSYRSIAYPVTVFGAARNSGGGLTAARKHYGRIEDQKHLPADIITRWDPGLPRVWSEQIIYPQTIHEVMIRGGYDGKVSYATLYGSLLAYEPHIAPHLWRILRAFVARDLRNAPRLGFALLKKLAGRVRTELRNGAGLGIQYDVSMRRDVAEVMTAMERLGPPRGIGAGGSEPRTPRG